LAKRRKRMSALRSILASLLVLVLVSAISAGHHEKDLMKEVAAIGDTISTAMVANDVETMLALYADDAISLPNYGPRMDGLDAFKKHHEQMTASGMKVLSFESEPTDVWKAGDQVIEIGVYKIAMEMPGMPQPIEDKGKYLTVYVRDKKGALKIKAETWNTDVNPMAAMGGDHGHDHP
jgi:uncharacterized protein (TIGR02246 family)